MLRTPLFVTFMPCKSSLLSFWQVFTRRSNWVSISKSKWNSVPLFRIHMCNSVTLMNVFINEISLLNSSRYWSRIGFRSLVLYICALFIFMSESISISIFRISFILSRNSVTSRSQMFWIFNESTPRVFLISLSCWICWVSASIHMFLSVSLSAYAYKLISGVLLRSWKQCFFPAAHASNLLSDGSQINIREFRKIMPFRSLPEW